MANIKSMQMWKSICKDERISVNKSFLGLVTTVKYVPTDSVVEGKVKEFSPENGERLKRILEMQEEQRNKALAEFSPQPIVNGNFRMEICKSQDEAFVAILLQQYIELNYETVAGMLVFEGKQAAPLCKLF